MIGQFHRAAIIQGVLLYTMNPSKTVRKSMGGWDYRTRIIPLLSSMKPARFLKKSFSLNKQKFYPLPHTIYYRSRLKITAKNRFLLFYLPLIPLPPIEFYSGWPDTTGENRFERFYLPSSGATVPIASHRPNFLRPGQRMPKFTWRR
jgi:hypothetical protein